MHRKDHWEHVYSTKPTTTVSWFQEHAVQSLDLIASTEAPASAAIIDVGGGASTLIDDLLAKGYSNLTVLDLSSSALDAARRRLGAAAGRIQWIEGDVTSVHLPVHAYDVWHDRAVFHFLTSPDERQAYVQSVLRAVRPGGHVIVSTFAEDGPLQCSGLPVMRYSPEELYAQFGSPFELVRHEKEEHLTPSGNIQKFVYCYCRMKGKHPDGTA